MPDTAIDPRHEKRIHRMQQLFAFAVGSDRAISDKKLIADFLLQREIIDQRIALSAPEWPLTQMNQVDLAILRTVLLEHAVQKTPIKVLIDEAIELAKEFGTESSPKFVNGVLGKVLIDS